MNLPAPSDDPEALVQALELQIALKRAQRLHNEDRRSLQTFAILFIIGLAVGVIVTMWYLNAARRPPSSPTPAPLTRAVR